ncbi:MULTISPECIES: hypothetical protein [unclassified Bradyrhizobium]|uniref:hypothetical protein n=1 Tax=unclassified Bradyrhizobium TaxID=2631580 RepID=UPI0033989B55
MTISQKEAITLAQEAIVRHYGSDLEPLSVQGVPAGQRVLFNHEGKRARCVIKFSSSKSNGRISFAPTEDGGFSGLSDTDFVAVVAPKSLGCAEWLLSFYDQETLLRAFTANREALKASGNSEGGQSWLAPFHEEGRNFRGEGDGYLKDALWTEPLNVRPSTGSASPSPEPPPNPSGQPPLSLSIKEAKEALGRKYDVSPDSIDITIRG